MISGRLSSRREFTPVPSYGSEFFLYDTNTPGEVLDISLGGEVRRGPSYPDPV